MDDDEDVEVHQGVKDSIHNPSNNRYSTLSDESHETRQMETMEVNERIDPASMRPVKDNKITMNGLTYTAPPIEDFPTPQVTSPVTRGLATNLTENFDNIPGIKLWVRPWGAYFSTDLQTTRSTIAKTLTDFLCRDKLVDLLQPDIEKKERLDPGGAPWHFLVINLTQDEYDIAIKTKVIASKRATLFILPYTQPIPNFVMLLKNITYDEDQVTAGIERVEKAIRDALISTPTLDRNLMELVEDPSRAGLELDLFIREVNVSLYKLSDPKGPSHVWKVFSSKMPSFSSIQSFNRFISRLLEISYPTTGYGTGQPATGPENYGCQMCKSRDHMKAECPFPVIPGWMNPIDDEIPWFLNTKRGGKAGRGNRGRGRAITRGRRF
ncbi:hypothetical protein Agabi119p4_8480 [Agaricus bisporus var. burnettii]|uniref:Uncharacterized protein n=1 Tax=Agaricus bisporus var. burnettii TaxID=192524 RepID=A0A8H7C815_AGABI|nr:hypothetical protein Agabi119p4_8480 [Agaricus bisporus var. burnettii]